MKSTKFLLLFLVVSISLNAQDKSDVAVFKSFLEYARTENLKDMDNSDRIISIARYFINAPYEGGTLEAEGPESLQVNLRGFDCTTFVENVLALNLTLKASNQDFDTFRSKLKYIRYRDGVLNEYPSRLHYTTDWIFNNQKKGVVKIVPLGKKAASFPLKVGYMSSHPDLYPALKNSPDFVSAMASHENRINHLKLKYLPKAKICQAMDIIRNGDIIAITTDTPGLDFSHLGFAYIDNNGEVHLFHASSSGKKVMITDECLFVYMSGVRKHTGIVVVRPL
jgi:hypothetical protein